MKIKRAKKRLLMSFFGVLIIFFCAMSAPFPVLAKDYVGNTPFNAGLKIVEFKYTDPNSGKEETITTAVWYPTTNPEKSYSYMSSAKKSFKSRVAFDAPWVRQDGTFPVIFYATGLYGSGVSSSFFSEYLARHGYVVVAPDFNDTKPPDYQEQIAWNRIKGGNTFRNPIQAILIGKRFVEEMEKDREKCLSYLENRRLNPALFVIDETLKLNSSPKSFLYKKLNENQIGIFGHSIGGVTILGLTGCHPNKKYQSDRIKAALLFSPGVYPYEKDLRKMKLPVMVMVGEKDPPNLGPPDKPRQTTYFMARPPRYLAIIKGGEHLDFSNGACGDTPLYKAVETIDKARVICRYGLAFLDRYVRKRSSRNLQLEKIEPGLLSYSSEEQPGNERKWGKSDDTTPDEDKKDSKRPLKRLLEKWREQRKK